MSFPSAVLASDPSRRAAPSAALPLTQLLHRARSGDPEDLETAIAAVYRELRRTAQTMLGSEWNGQSLVATELVHETFLRLFGNETTDWENRRHFFGSAAIAMRRILIERLSVCASNGAKSSTPRRHAITRRSRPATSASCCACSTSSAKRVLRF